MSLFAYSCPSVYVTCDVCSSGCVYVIDAVVPPFTFNAFPVDPPVLPFAVFPVIVAYLLLNGSLNAPSIALIQYFYLFVALR